jgi:hypothetical protein
VPKEEYESLHKKKYKEPSTLIRFSTTVEDCSGCPYLMDEEDEAYLSNINSLSEDEFEKMMWEFETITDTHWPHIYLVMMIYASAIK